MCKYKKLWILQIRNFMSSSLYNSHTTHSLLLLLLLLLPSVNFKRQQKKYFNFLIFLNFLINFKNAAHIIITPIIYNIIGGISGTWIRLLYLSEDLKFTLYLHEECTHQQRKNTIIAEQKLILKKVKPRILSLLYEHTYGILF